MVTVEDLFSFRDELDAYIMSEGFDTDWLTSKSGVRLPLGHKVSGEHMLEEWETLCYLCFWLGALRGSLPSEFLARVTLGPSNRWVSWVICTDFSKFVCTKS